MALELVLNELSAAPPADDVLRGRERIGLFVDVVRKCASAGFPKILRVTRSFFQVLLAPGYPVGRWLSDTAVDRDVRLVLRTWSTKAPYIEDLLENELKAAAGITEFAVDETQVTGLAVAYLLDTIAISFASDVRWATSRVALRLRGLDDDSNLSEEMVEVKHASAGEHVDGYQGWISARRRTDVSDGIGMWAQRSVLFESLDFCSRVEGQLSSLADNNPELALIVRACFELQDYCTTWTEGAFNPSALLSVSVDSKATLDKYGAERDFLCPDGKTRRFSWHLKRGARRVYFIPDPTARRILIGHVGLHLRTVLYSN
jgi:hypothetical protein